MNFAGIPEPWGTLLQLIVGPVGAIVALCAIIFFLWRLFREEQRENRTSMQVVATLTETIKDMKDELKIWREVASR